MVPYNPSHKNQSSRFACLCASHLFSKMHSVSANCVLGLEKSGKCSVEGQSLSLDFPYVFLRNLGRIKGKEVFAL